MKLWVFVKNRPGLVGMLTIGVLFARTIASYLSSLFVGFWLFGFSADAWYLVKTESVIHLVRLFQSTDADDYLIRHFRAHKTEFLNLRKLFDAGLLPSWTTADSEEYLITPARHDGDTSAKSLLRQTHLAHVGGSTDTLWLPTPYSPDSARQSAQLQRDALVRRNLNRYAEASFDFFAPFGCVQSWNFIDRKCKSVSHFPTDPKIEDAELWLPINTAGEVRRAPVKNSLDGYPAGFQAGSKCYYRKIEPHWFLKLC